MLIASSVSVRLGCDSADKDGHHLGRPARDVREDVGQQVGTAALLGRSVRCPAVRPLDNPVRVGGDELRASEAAVFRAREGVRASRLPSAVTTVSIAILRKTT